jgi:hypothetical protein
MGGVSVMSTSIGQQVLTKIDKSLYDANVC